MQFSVITPTFDRCAIVRRAVDSALTFARKAGDSGIVVVDNAPSDGTVDMLRSTYAREIYDGLLKIVVRGNNGGSTAAKSDGGHEAKGD